MDKSTRRCFMWPFSIGTWVQHSKMIISIEVYGFPFSSNIKMNFLSKIDNFFFFCFKRQILRTDFVYLSIAYTNYGKLMSIERSNSLNRGFRNVSRFKCNEA